MTIIDLSGTAPGGTGTMGAGAASRRLRGYLAEPAGTGPFPPVLMIH
jgi:carboxymethylenebutenolidase